MNITYLQKAGDDVISHCSCGDGRMTFPAQMDCPWCGCGWLFTCISCRKAFTFAIGVELETTWEELAREDLIKKWHKEPAKKDVHDWVGAMKAILHDVMVGERYVLLDGSILRADSKDIEFDGWHAHHRFNALPQFDALDDRAILRKTLGNRDYWNANALSEED
jgi:hypothetical protein